MKIKTAIEYMGARSPNVGPALHERDVTHFAIDSRDVQAGSLFFAFSQPEYENNGFNGNFEDATKYVRSAFEKGASAAVVRTDRFEEHRPDLYEFKEAILLVDDVIAAFQKLAHGVYSEWNRPVVAITGSAGKTTAKELTAHVLEASGKKVLRNIKNFNTGIGHPLTVLNLAADPTYDVAVLEMGMSTPMNEIARLCRITPPDVAVELNVLPVHVEHLGSIENVAKAKSELVEGMKGGGTAILNADDPRVAAMHKLSKGQVVTFGVSSAADVSAQNIRAAGFGKTDFRLATPSGTADVSFRLNGLHNVSNALAAAAVGHTFGMDVFQIATSLNSVSAPPQRGEVLHFADGFTIINDSYNSNPTALVSMVRTLIDGCGPNERKIVVAGEMLELGGDEAEIHRQAGRDLAASGIHRLIGVRGLAKEMVDAAIAAGLKESAFAVDSRAAGELLVKEIRSGDVVLVKGSRGVKTERVIEALTNRFELEDTRKATG
ncbi:MAG TPA: UDP-N-acetylmuramoyl-tripeptide--D-alanyl-D-alanine ligase [Pyrinomonadaceae bacterium]|nr:UDP-N-acetylmuramoyl-tripeptide--D-alanyl-D-alanine ligase [Pyrinomonadaceae bacterium]